MSLKGALEVVHTYNGILFSLEKVGNSASRSNLDEPQEYHIN
jgi:hypothetical protein